MGGRNHSAWVIQAGMTTGLWMNAARCNAWPGCRAAVPTAAHEGRAGKGVPRLSGGGSAGRLTPVMVICADSAIPVGLPMISQSNRIRIAAS